MKKTNLEMGVHLSVSAVDFTSLRPGSHAKMKNIHSSFTIHNALVFVLFMAGLLFANLTGAHAQGCADDDGIPGRIAKVEYHPLEGEICGFSEYTYRGNWSSNTQYKAGDSVLRGGGFWRTNSDNSGQEPGCSSSYWVKTSTTKFHVETSTIIWNMDFYANTYQGGFLARHGTSQFRRVTSFDIDCGTTNNECSGSGSHHVEDNYGPNSVGDWLDAYWNFNIDCSTHVWGGFYGNIDFDQINQNVSLSTLTFDTSEPSYSEELSIFQSVKSITKSTNRRGIPFSWWTEVPGTMIEQNRLSVKESGSEKIAEALAELDLEGEDWESGWRTTAWLGSWYVPWQEPHKFAFSGQAIRYWVAFTCLPEKPKLEYTYWVWPIGCDEQQYGEEEKETKSIAKADIEEQEDGQKWIKSFIVPKDGYNKRLVEVKLLTPCGSGEGGGAGNENGVGLGSGWWWVSLGEDTEGYGVGNLRVEESNLTSDSASPRRLKYDGGFNAQVEVIKDDQGGVRQVKAPEAFADVVILDAESYEIRFYDPSEVDIEPEIEIISAGDPVENPDTYVEIEVPTGLYVVTGGVPFAVWKVEQPSATQLKISQTTGSNSDSYLFEQDGDIWTLDRGNGGQTEELSTSMYQDQGVWYREKTVILKDANGTPSHKVWTKEQFFAFGLRPVEQVIDPEGAALSTTWTYYTNEQADGGSFAQVKQVINPDETWERYEYDSEGRISKTVTPWLDAAPGSSDSQCRVVETSYQENQGEITATKIEKILGTEVGRRYWVKSTDGTQIQNITATQQGAGIGASSNLLTVTNHVPSGEFKGKTQSVQHANGTLSTYEYQRDGQSGALTTTVRRGASSGGSVVAGSETITVEDRSGRLLSRVEKDIASGVIIEGMTVTSVDAFGRPTFIEYNDGTYEETSYSCCGIEWQRDRDGMLTSYTYDSLKRVVSESRQGLTTLYSYDGSGRVLTVTRRGSDSSDHVVETNTYDLAGRLTSRKNALNQTTSYSESVDGNGQRIRTTTLPDNSTMVEIAHRDGNLKEVSGSATHPVAYEYGISGNGGQFVKEIRIGNGGATTEWVRTVSDIAGRTARIEYPDSAEETLIYNNLGQLSARTDPDGITTQFVYNGEGEQIEQIIQAGGSADRKTKTERSVLSGPLLRTVTQQWDGSGYTTVATMDQSPNGRYRKETRFGLETESMTVYNGTGDATETITHPNGTTTVNQYTQGRLVSSVTPTGSTTFEYDPHGRLVKQIDGRVGTQTIYTHNAADQITQVNAGGMVTSYTLNALGQVTTESLPGNRTITRTYRPTGELLSEGGTATYPVTYTYDPQGRRTSMTTSSGTTTWSYNGQRGWLTGKTDADNKTATYSYTPAGRLATRTWARGIVTTYGYDGAGDLTSTSYSDGTPGTSLIRDARGQPTSVTDATGTRSLVHNAAGQLVSETISGGIGNGLELAIGYDALLRKSSSAAKRGGSTLISTSYSYDGASRLSAVHSGTRSVGYNYLAGSSLVGQLAFNQSGTAMTTTKTYDSLDRLSSISSAPATGDPVSYAYQYNAAGQREQMTLANGTYWTFGYNDRGEVTSGGKKLSGGTNLNGYQFGYSFDAIGNRVGTVTNGRSAGYTANNLNQYVSRTIPSYVNVVGEAKTDTTVTVNGQATGRQGTFYHRELTVANSISPVFLTTEVTGTRGSDVAARQGKVFVPKTPESFSHDADGNLLSDGRWNYTWDGENRLIAQETTTAAAAAGAPRVRLSFTYDYMGRRTSKKLERNWSGSSYQDSYTLLFVWDGWNMVAEVLQGGPRVRTYVWGLDLSGSPQGAGGVGGLLFINQYPENKSYAVGYDGNGNVTALFDMAEQGALAAHYEYGPFGEPLVVTGPYAEVNPIRWSTKYQDRESGFAYYGFRFYNPESGRWPNRDPIEEQGGVNLYGFVGNNPINVWDKLGLEFTGTYSISSRKLTLVDNDRKRGWFRKSPLTCECKGSSGTNSADDIDIRGVGPLPPGQYVVLDRGSGFFRYVLDPVDVKPLNDQWDGRDDGIIRNAFRIHLSVPTEPRDGSDGCIVTNETDYEAMGRFIAGTKKGPTFTIVQEPNVSNPMTFTAQRVGIITVSQ